MIKLDNSALVPGMVLARDVYDLKSSLLIVNAGVTLTEELIDKLQQFPRIEIFVDEMSADIQEKHEKMIAVKMEIGRERLLTRARNLITSAGAQPPDPEVLQLMVGDLEEQIDISSNVLLNLSHIKVFDDYLFSHVVNVAMLALIIGKQLRLSPAELRQLGVAALLHDYGMLKLDHSIYDHNRKLTAAEWEQIKLHPGYGVEMLQKAHLSPEVLQAVLDHHERMDGSGYPNHKSASELGLFSKILAVADVYDACISRRKYRDPLTPNFTLKTLLNDFRLFDLDVLKAFITAMAIYPIGSYVRLNTGEIGKVVGCNQNEPFRPDVQILLNAQHQKIVPPYRLKLNEKENRQNYIEGNLDGEQLQAVLDLLKD